MARDYKYRAQHTPLGSRQGRSPRKAPPKTWWRWALVAALVVAFALFLNLVTKLVSDQPGSVAKPAPEQTVTQTLPITPGNNTGTAATEKTVEPVANSEPKAEPEPVQAEEPRYDFYTILPQAETVIPDYEIQSRVREELVGKTKATKYNMQAGSFREAADAERHKARLASLGIESRIENAKIGNVIWHRVKIGPYDNPSSVSTIKSLLEKNGIGVIVTEQDK